MLITYLRSKKHKEKKEVFILDKKKSIIIFSMLVIVAVISGIAITAYANDNSFDDTELPACSMHRRLFKGRGHGRGGMFGPIEVNEEYEANVIAIAENDEDVKTLLADGYTISGVKPMIRQSVEADGDVTSTATTAVIMLTMEDSANRAAVIVDLDANGVTKIVILTKTIIEKNVESIEAITPEI